MARTLKDALEGKYIAVESLGTDTSYSRQLVRDLSVLGIQSSSVIEKVSGAAVLNLDNFKPEHAPGVDRILAAAIGFNIPLLLSTPVLVPEKEFDRWVDLMDLGGSLLKLDDREQGSIGTIRAIGLMVLAHEAKIKRFE